MSGSKFDLLQRVAGPVSRETFLTLLEFESQFVRWSSRINLAAPSTLPDLWSRHILDSAQLLKLAPDSARWLDLGSGGGFPGAVVAILSRERPGSHVHLVESNGKKASFLRTVLAEAGAPATVHARRIEDVAISAPDVVTARALAPLPVLLGLSSRWLSAGALGLFHKGRGYSKEIEESRHAWDFDLVEHVSAISDDSAILEISGLRRK